jgi:hypothetical protein
MWRCHGKPINEKFSTKSFMPKTIPKKAKKGKCVTPYCRNQRAKEHLHCSKCMMRRWRNANRLKAQYSSLKLRAKDRKIPFKLTFDEFKALAEQSGYSEKTNSTGKTALCLHRRGDKGPYSVDNIEIMTRVDNNKLQNMYRYNW